MPKPKSARGGVREDDRRERFDDESVVVVDAIAGPRRSWRGVVDWSIVAVVVVSERARDKLSHSERMQFAACSSCFGVLFLSFFFLKM